MSSIGAGNAALSAHSMNWAQQAACQGQTTLFFPPHAERPEARELREARARAVCLACPVLGQCRALARQRREYGFWGGETEGERAAAGYPVALPVGQVAKCIRILRQVALASAPAPLIGNASVLSPLRPLRPQGSTRPPVVPRPGSRP